MNPDAITIAKSRLRVAESAIWGMLRSRPVPAASPQWETHELEEFSDHWFVFLTAWKGVYTVLEQGTKGNPRSMQWFGAKKAERRADPLLKYLFAARNDEEHGLGQSVANRQRSQWFEVTKHGSIVAGDYDAAAGRWVRLIGEDGTSMARLVSENLNPGPHLVEVRLRGGQFALPPAEHLGKPVDIRPPSVAYAGLLYVQALVAEAEKIGKP